MGGPAHIQATRDRQRPRQQERYHIARGGCTGHEGVLKVHRPAAGKREALRRRVLPSSCSVVSPFASSYVAVVAVWSPLMWRLLLPQSRPCEVVCVSSRAVYCAAYLLSGASGKQGGVQQA